MDISKFLYYMFLVSVYYGGFIVGLTVLLSTLAYFWRKFE